MGSGSLEAAEAVSPVEDRSCAGGGSGESQGGVWQTEASLGVTLRAQSNGK